MPKPNAQQMRMRANNMMAGFSSGQRVVVVIAALAVVIGGVIFAQWASKPTMVPLYSNLSSADASAITTKLQASKTAYTLSDGGNTINVPQSAVYQTRLDMASASLPSGSSDGSGSGYTLLDKTGITTSDFLEHVDYQRAIEGELEKTINSIQGVSGSSVHLVIPTTDVFSSDAQKPTASVLVKTSGSQQLGSQQVQSIVNLVAGAVESLDPTNVTVADDKGRMLASPGQGVTGAQSDSQNQMTGSVESDLNTKIEQLLTPVVGTGKAVVQANATLNWDKINSTQKVYNPNNKPVTALSSSSQTETYGSGAGGAGSTATGCLGVVQSTTSQACNTNTSQTNSATTGGTSTSTPYVNSNITQDNGVDETVTQTENTPGQISRVSVAVLLDSNVPNVDVATVQQLVTQAAGLQSSRGDTVTVSRMPFDTTTAKANAKALSAASSAAKTSQMLGLVKTVVTVLIIGIVLAVLLITTKKRAGSYSSTPISLAELDAAMPMLPSADELLDGMPVELDNSPEALERAKVDKEITSLIEKQPDEVAGLLRSWLADRRS